MGSCRNTAKFCEGVFARLPPVKRLESPPRLVYNSAMRNHATTVRLAVLVGLILGITALHYLTGSYNFV